MKSNIRFPRFDRAAVDAIKSLPEHARRWNPDARCWMVEAEHILTVATLVEKIFPELAEELRSGDAYAEARKAARGVEEARTASRATDAKVDIPAPEGLEYMPFQRAGIAYAMKREGALIGDEMGCVEGEAVIHVNRGGKGWRVKLADAYRRFHGLDRTNWNWDPKIPTYCRALCGDELRQHRVRDILDKGIRPVVQLILASGKQLRLTPDHAVAMTDGTWREAAQLVAGDEVLTNGKFIDKDGYVRVCGQQNHPRANTTGQVYEHILVMEKKLGRPVTVGELIHHGDENRANNHPDNLELQTHTGHHKIHRRHRNMNGGTAGHGGKVIFLPHVDTVLSVEPAGEAHVYDIVMENPHRNFVANGLVVHNCGKTIQAIGVVNATPDARRILVVCPASLRLNWQRELQKWLVLDLTVGVAQGKNWPETDVVVINYDILKRHKAKLDAEVYDILIVDECHYLKNAKTQRTKAVLGAWNEDPKKVVKAIAAKRRLFLTGTPIVNRPIELWPLLRSLDPNNLGRYWKGYVKRYCDGYQDVVRTRYGTKTIWQVGGASHLEELQDRLRATLMVRRLKAEVLTELPAKRRQVIEVPPNGAVRIVKAEQKAWREVQETLEGLRAEVELAKASENEEDYLNAVAALHEQEKAAFTEMSRLRHETALAKVDYVVEHVLNATDKVVVFAHHRDVIDTLVTALREAERKVVVITGDTPMAARQAAVDAFQNDPETTVFVGNIQAAGVGLTLTAASHVVFAELDWVPGNMSQAEDRCHRIGQTQSVLVQHLVLDGTLDATMAHTLVEKQEVIDKALDKPTTMKTVTPIEPPATKSTKRDQLGAEAANFTDKMVAAVHEALQRLADMCDGARDLDGMGFNRIDTRIGHSLAAQEHLTKRQAALGRKIVRKYHRQIGEELLETMKTKKKA